MSLRCGIIGLPNVGKSTIFNALTALCAEASNYPFCTIKPNVGQVVIPDERLNGIAEFIKTKKIVPATIEFVDIAGLVRGAHNGEGLGNQFLSQISEMDALAHVIRSFQAGDVAHVEGNLDPLRDVEIVETEILLKDIELLDRFIHRQQKVAKSGDKQARQDVQTAQQLVEILNRNEKLRHVSLNQNQLAVVNELKLLSYKPVIYVLNISDNEDDTNTSVTSEMKEYTAKTNANIVYMRGKLEEELIQLDPADRAEFMADLGIDELGLTILIKETYKALRLVNFFTANKNEIHAWTIAQGTRAPQAAGKVHSDFERGFISAEVITFDDFIKYEGEHGAKEHGVARLEGKDYVVREGDIIFFHFNV